MRIQSLRKLVPASIVALVLALAYFAPAFGLVAPQIQSGFGVPCGRFGYGYHGGKHLASCPNPVYPSPAIQLGGVPPQPFSPNPGPARAATKPSAQQLPAPIAPPIVHHVVAPSVAPQALGQVRQTGGLLRLSAESPLVVASLIAVALASFGAAILLRWRRRRQT